MGKIVASVIAIIILASLTFLPESLPLITRSQSTMEWLIPGVRVWYLGTQFGSGEGGASSVDYVNVYTIKEFGPDGLTVHSFTAASHYTAGIFSHDELVPDPHSEGEFWISPARLAQLRVGDIIKWTGDELMVVDRGLYTYDEFSSKYPTDPLPPIMALFSEGRRDIVTLEGVIESKAVYTFSFDVETGIMIRMSARDRYNQGATLGYLELAEINYDFKKHEAFPEPEGPHADYGLEGVYMDMYSGLLLDLNVFVGGRYGDETLYFVYITVGTGTVPYGAGLILSTGKEGVYGSLVQLPGSSGTIMPLDVGVENNTYLGTHSPFYVGKDVGKDRIIVWGAEMINNGGNSFTTTQATSNFYFQSLSFDNEGYVTGMTIVINDMGLSVPLQLQNPGFNNERGVYQQYLGKAQPVTTTTQPMTFTVATTTTTTSQTTTAISPVTATTTVTQSQTTSTSATVTSQATGTGTSHQTTSGPNNTAPITGGADTALSVAIGGAVGLALGVAVLFVLKHRLR